MEVFIEQKVSGCCGRTHITEGKRKTSSQVDVLTEQKGRGRCLAKWTFSQNRMEEEDRCLAKWPYSQNRREEKDV